MQFILYIYYRSVCERVWRHTGLQCARIAYNEARNLVNNLIKRIKIHYYRHKLEYADNKDMFGTVNSLINKPKDREFGSKRNSLHAVELSQRTQTASNLPAPCNGARFTVFWHAVRTRWMAGTAAHKSG